MSWKRTKCAIAHCSITKNELPDGKLFKFPKKGTVKYDEWLALAEESREHIKSLNTPYICSKHFKNAFIGKKYLKKNAYPSLLLKRSVAISDEELICFDPTRATVKYENCNELVLDSNDVTVEELNLSPKKEPDMYENYETFNFHDDEDPGSRCGEIYVGNNAKKWTFICTFCDKSVRDFDEFIAHIKHAHVNLPPPLPVDPSDTGHLNESIEHSNSMKHDVPQFNPLDKAQPEYVDYKDVLDANVQTVPEVILSDNNGHIEVPDNEPATPQTRIKTEPESEKEDFQPLKYKPPSLVVKPRRQRKGRSRRKQVKGPYCQICKRTFQYHSLYRNHMVKHTSKTPFQCTICKKGLKSKQAIRYHMTTHQPEKTFKCELCEAGFYHEWQFVSHMVTHRSENNHPCEVCGKVNRTKCDKDIHMRTHIGDRPFACEFCLKRFRLRHHLSNHLKFHLTYRCDFCRKRFSNGVPMKKPYTCSDCVADANNMQVSCKQEEEVELVED